MNEEPDDKKKNELLSAVRGAEEEAKSTADMARSIGEHAQNVRDVARLVKEFVECLPDDSYLPAEKWNDQTNQWNQWSEYSRNARIKSSMSDPFLFATDVRSIGASGMFFDFDIPTLPPEVQARAGEVRTTFQNHLAQPNLVADVESELNRLQLNVARVGNESAQVLLRAAEHSLQAPGQGPTVAAPVLIPLRGAINRAVADLLSRRPQQEKSNNIEDKVQSICRQCGIDDIRQEDITTLANEARGLNGVLSGSKDAKMPRDLIKANFNRGLRFFREFLRGIDHNKLRN